MQTSKNSIALIFLAVVLILIAGFATYNIYLSPKTPSEEDLSLKVATTTVDIPAPNINTGDKPVKPAETAPTPLPAELVATDWKTYTNAAYNFKVDYPTGWTVGSGIFDTRGSLLALSFCPPSFAANGDCKYSKTDRHSYAPFLLYVSKTADKTGGNKVVWNHEGLVYELRENDDRFGDLYEKIIVTLKFLK